MNPASIDQWFPVGQQRKYVSMLKGEVGLTRTRAEYFVRLWAFLLLKHLSQLGTHLRQPLTELYVPEGFVPCTHQEASELFYSDKERGSDRAAGMMIDNFVRLGLIDKEFDGNSVCIRIRPLVQNLRDETVTAELVELKIDTFNPRTDAIAVANFLASNYSWMNKKNIFVPQMARKLRRWARDGATVMRVLRRCDNYHPVGFYILCPVCRESEDNFFQIPSKSFYLILDTEIDPLAIATPGDVNCTSVFLRSCTIDFEYLQPSHICLFLKDIQKTLQHMLADFPELCDFYGMALNPIYKLLASALSFQKTGPEDPQLGICWIYKSVDQFLALDIETAMSKIEFS